MVMGYGLKIIKIILAILFCGMMARRHGAGTTIALWAGLMGVACSLGGALLKTAGVGQVSWKNYVGGFFLSWGYFIGRGQLLPIVVTSWIVWSLIGAAAALVAVHEPSGGSSSSGTMQTLLYISWAIDAAALMYGVGVMAKNRHLHSGGVRVIVTFMGLIAVMVAASVLLWSRGHLGWAVFVTGAPLLVVGIIATLFVGGILLFNKGGRWN